MPSAEAPTIGRVISKVASAPEEPAFWPERARSSFLLSLSMPPSSWSPGMRQSSRITSAVWLARMPILVSLLPWRRPGVSGPITNEAWPRWPSSGSTVATTTCTSAMPPLVMKTLVPFRTHSSPSSLAVVRRLFTSEPAWGSVTA